MKHTVKYDMESIAGRNKAVADFEEWLGESRTELLRRALLNGTFATLDQFRLACSFAGVEGAPVTAFAERHGLYD